MKILVLGKFTFTVSLHIICLATLVHSAEKESVSSVPRKIYRTKTGGHRKIPKNSSGISNHNTHNATSLVPSYAVTSSRSLPSQVENFDQWYDYRSQQINDSSNIVQDKYYKDKITDTDQWFRTGIRGSVSKGNYHGNSGDQTLPTVAPRHSDEPYKFDSYSSSTNSRQSYANLLKLYEQERAARQLLMAASGASNRQGTLPGVVASASSNYGTVAAPPTDYDAYGDSLALGSHHHGHGWGWGWKPNHYVSTVNTNAIGLLGLLGLLTLLSNVLYLLTTTTTTAAGRRRRSLDSFGQTISDQNQESQQEKLQRVFAQVVPLLFPLAHARIGYVPVDCTLRGVCQTNSILVQEYGIQGRPVGTRITDAISMFLSEAAATRRPEVHPASGIKTAGLKGRNQENCHQEFPVCEALVGYDFSTIPFILRMDNIQGLIKAVRKLTGSGYSPTLVKTS